MTNKRSKQLQQQLFERLKQVPEEKQELVMSLLLNNVSTLLSGMEIGKSEKKG